MKLSIQTLLILLVVVIGGIVILYWKVKVRKEVEKYIDELAKIIKGNIKRKKLFLFREFEIRGEYKGREIFCYTDEGSDIQLSAYPWLIISTRTKNAEIKEKPFFTFKLSTRQIRQTIFLDIFSGYLRYQVIYINKPCYDNLLKIINELIEVAEKIENLDWGKIVTQEITI